MAVARRRRPCSLLARALGIRDARVLGEARVVVGLAVGPTHRDELLRARLLARAVRPLGVARVLGEALVPVRHAVGAADGHG